MSLSLLLRCQDLEQTRAFYRDALDFEVGEAADPLAVEGHGAGLLFTCEDLWKCGPVCSGTLYFSVPDVDAYYAAVRDRAPLAWPLQDMPYGSREFAVIDCNGYYLAFQQA